MTQAPRALCVQVHFQEQVNEHRGKAISQQVGAGRHELQADPQERLKGHDHESSPQQESASKHETDGELEGLSQISRSLERGVPASVSSPDLLAEPLQQHAAQSKQSGAQRTASEGQQDTPLQLMGPGASGHLPHDLLEGGREGLQRHAGTPTPAALPMTQTWGSAMLHQPHASSLCGRA